MYFVAGYAYQLVSERLFMDSQAVSQEPYTRRRHSLHNLSKMELYICVSLPV